MVILTCITNLNLNWYKSYDKKPKNANNAKPQRHFGKMMLFDYVILKKTVGISDEEKREPTARIELATFRLRSDCSTTKLCWLG